MFNHRCGSIRFRHFVAPYRTAPRNVQHCIQRGGRAYVSAPLDDCGGSSADTCRRDDTGDATGLCEMVVVEGDLRVCESLVEP